MQSSCSLRLLPKECCINPECWFPGLSLSVSSCKVVVSSYDSPFILTSSISKCNVTPWHLLYPCVSCIIVFARSFFNTEYNIGQCKLNTKVAYRLMNALCLLLTDVITDRWYTELDLTAHRHVLDFISGDGIFERNINIKKKHMQWMQVQGICFQEKKKKHC